MTAQLNELLAEAIEENRQEKICLIEDIFKVRRLLFGFGFEEHLRSITEPSAIFDELYELSIDDLQLILAANSAEMSLKSRELGGFKHNETTHNQ